MGTVITSVNREKELEQKQFKTRKRKINPSQQVLYKTE